MLLMTALVLILITGVIVDVLICLHMIGKHQQRMLYKLQRPPQTDWLSRDMAVNPLHRIRSGKRQHAREHLG